MSSPQSDLIARLVDRVLEKTASLSTVELGASLGVDSSYITKLRGGWRPGRVRPELERRLVELDPESPRVATKPPEFYDGILYAAQAYAETQARLIAEARAGLASQINPAAVRAALDEGEAMIRDGEKKLASRQQPDQSRKSSRRPA